MIARSAVAALLRGVVNARDFFPIGAAPEFVENARDPNRRFGALPKCEAPPLLCAKTGRGARAGLDAGSKDEDVRYCGITAVI